jgi:hypothetical protein
MKASWCVMKADTELITADSPALYPISSSSAECLNGGSYAGNEGVPFSILGGSTFPPSPVVTVICIHS